MRRRARLAILVNIIPPYSVAEYQKIGRHLETFFFYSGEERNRTTWKGVETTLYPHPVKKSWGFTLQIPVGRRNRTYDYRFIHVNPGYLLDLLSTRPDAVITIEMGFRTLMALIYGSLYRKPVWVGWGGTLHTSRNIGPLKKVWRKIVARWAKRWISYGKSSTEYLMSLGIPEERILETQRGVDEQAYLEPTEPAVQLEPRPVFLYVGQFIGRKGVDEFLKVVAKQQENGWRFSLLLVGDGPEEGALEELARELGLRDVCFYPAQPPAAMPSVYRSADYLVFPTLEDVWGLVVSEALWSGVPVLCSVYAGSARELLPEENLFDPLDHGSFGAVMERALEGRIASPDLSRMKTREEVAAMIIDEVGKAL